jgi:hypothetical protein
VMRLCWITKLRHSCAVIHSWFPEIWAGCAGRKEEAVQLHRSVPFYGPIFTTIHFHVATLLCYSVRYITDLRDYVNLGFCNLWYGGCFCSFKLCQIWNLWMGAGQLQDVFQFVSWWYGCSSPLLNIQFTNIQ